MFFNNWKSIWEIIVMGIGAYFSFLIMIRISGKRSLSKLNAFDIIVSVALGSILASTITSSSLTLADGITGFAVLLVLQYLISKLSKHSDSFENLIKAEPSLLFYQGEFLEEALEKQRVTKRDVLYNIRKSGFLYLEQVEMVILETDGTFSVVSAGDGDGETSLHPALRTK